jgi:N-acetylmuramoyl-L-alanine amidase
MMISLKTNIIRIFAVMAFLMPFTMPCASAKDFVVVIDPGHGGKDFGCIGDITNEKSIVLSVGKLLGSKILSKYDDVKVVYTRNTDRYLTLQERANVANKAGGDLFISIHINSVDKSSAGRESVHGASVYALGLHRSGSNLEVAKRENSVIALEKDYTTTYKGFDPNSSESYIIFELNQNQHMQQSLNFADRAQRQLVKTAGRANKNVRQAGFWVLWATSMPAVLVELDFICNPTSEKFLASSDGQDKCATALFNAFSEYKEYYNHQLDSSIGKAPSSKQSSASIQQPEPETVESAVEAKPKKTTKADDNEVVYKIQFLTSGKKLKDDSAQFKGLDTVETYYENGTHKYTYGTTTSLNEAKKMLSEVKKQFPEAFIIKMQNGKRIK